MKRERPLHTHPEGDLSYGERLAQASALAADDHTLEDLDTLTPRFDDPDVHLDGVSRPELWQVIAQAWFLDEIDLVHGIGGCGAVDDSTRPLLGRREDPAPKSEDTRKHEETHA